MTSVELVVTNFENAAIRCEMPSVPREGEKLRVGFKDFFVQSVLYIPAKPFPVGPHVRLFVEWIPARPKRQSSLSSDGGDSEPTRQSESSFPSTSA